MQTRYINLDPRGQSQRGYYFQLPEKIREKQFIGRKEKKKKKKKEKKKKINKNEGQTNRQTY